jgi:FixJ family two-component response regulator
MIASAESESIVFVIDDDASIRETLKSLFESVGQQVAVFDSPSQFLQTKMPDMTSCLVLDVRLRGSSGLEFQAELIKSNIRIPIIFLSGHGDIPMTVRAMKAGAIEFLTKPFRDQDVLDAVRTALERDRSRRQDESRLARVRALYETLTPREQEVAGLVSAGFMNKQIAAQLGLSEITVKLHRGNLMKKMEAKSLAELVVMAELLGIRRAKR